MLTPDPILITFALFGKTFKITLWTLVAVVPAQTLFTARTLVQWVLSEKHQRSVAPASYWWMSLAASLAMVAYSLQRQEIPFLLGAAVNLVPYTRNLMLSYRLTKGGGPLGLGLCATALACMVVVVSKQKVDVQSGWFIFGLVGSVIFNSRFLIQWLQSEREGESRFSLTFWYTSLVGALLLLVYAIARGDVGFIIAYLFNSIPYARNIMLIRGSAGGDARSGADEQ